MPHLNPKLLITLSFIYILMPILAWASLTTFALRRIPDSAQTANDRLIPIYNTQPLNQIIIPKNAGLSTILIYLKNARLLNTEPFTFNLSDSSGQTLRNIEISGKNIGDGDNIRFQFEPIPDSAGQKYTVTLQAPYTNYDSPKIEAGVSSGEPGLLAYELFYRPTSRLSILSHSATHILLGVTRMPFVLLFIFSALVFFFLSSKVLSTANLSQK